MALEHPEIWGALAFLFVAYIEMRIRFGHKVDVLALNVQDIKDVVVIKKKAVFRQ